MGHPSDASMKFGRNSTTEKSEAFEEGGQKPESNCEATQSVVPNSCKLFIILSLCLISESYQFKSFVCCAVRSCQCTTLRKDSQIDCAIRAFNYCRRKYFSESLSNTRRLYGYHRGASSFLLLGDGSCGWSGNISVGR